MKVFVVAVFSRAVNVEGTIVREDLAGGRGEFALRAVGAVQGGAREMFLIVSDVGWSRNPSWQDFRLLKAEVHAVSYQDSL